MADSQVAKPPLGASSHTRDGMTQDQVFELEQYEKIIRLRDKILAGTHPTIKPSQEQILKARKVSSSQQGHPTDAADQGSRANVAARSERSRDFDPILLEKSSELISAEFRVQRERLERLLSDEVADAKRSRRPLMEDGLRDLDLSAVLSQALSLAQPPAASNNAKGPLPANLDDTRSDSFDDDTFYSSQHDTSPPRSSSAAGGEQASLAHVPTPSRQGGSAKYGMAASAPHVDTSPNATGSEARSIAPLHVVPSRPTAVQAPPPPGPIVVPGLDNYTGPGVSGGWQNPSASGGTGSSGKSDIRPFHVAPTTRQQPAVDEAYADANPPSPFIQNHDMPSPALHAAQTTTQVAQPVATKQHLNGQSAVERVNAQVVALRNEPQSATSTDSSNHGPKSPPRDRPKGKKKKRKADRQGREAEGRDKDTVYIKPEPRSPSPIASSTYIRPSKRQRQAHRQDVEPVLGYGSNADSSHTAAYPVHHEGPTAVAPATGGSIYVHDDYAAPANGHGARHSSGGVPYHPYERPPPPPQTSYHYPSEAVEVAPTEAYYYEGQGHPGYATRRIPMQTPGPQRIYVDHLGNESLHPPHAVMRQSVAPPAPYAEPQIAYEHPQPRAVSRYAELPRYPEGAPPYARSMSMHPAPRRVVTQPEYASRPYEESWPAQYTSQHMPPPPGPSRRLVELGRPEYGERAASIRPVQSAAVEYQPSQDYNPGGGSHANQAERIYIRDVPEKQITAQPYGWGYERQATENPAVRQEPTDPHPPQHCYAEPPRPSAPEVIYANDPRRAMYQQERGM